MGCKRWVNITVILCSHRCCGKSSYSMWGGPTQTSEARRVQGNAPQGIVVPHIYIDESALYILQISYFCDRCIVWNVYVCRENQRCPANKALWTKSRVYCVWGVGLWVGGCWVEWGYCYPRPSPVQSISLYMYIWKKRSTLCAGGVITCPWHVRQMGWLIVLCCCWE